MLVSLIYKFICWEAKTTLWTVLIFNMQTLQHSYSHVSTLYRVLVRASLTSWEPPCAARPSWSSRIFLNISMVKGYLSSSAGDGGQKAEGSWEAAAEALKVAPLHFQSIQSKALHTAVWLLYSSSHSDHQCARAACCVILKQRPLGISKSSQIVKHTVGVLIILLSWAKVGWDWDII